MDSRHLSAFSSCNDVSQLSSSNIETSDIILMVWPTCNVLICVLLFLSTSKESLLSRGKILDDTEGSGHEDNLIVVLSKVEASLVSVSRKSVDVVNLVSTIWPRWIAHYVLWWLFVDLLQEELSVLWRFLSFVLHF